jgi:hypothetical protein
MRVHPSAIGAALCCLFLAATAGATVQRRETSIVDLVGQSELILRGTIKSVSDGIDERGIPYTEVTMRVSDAIRGDVGAQYTFRQFGLLKPRSMGNGKLNLMVTPAGWATYAKGEDTVLFLYRRAKWTGLQTTVGLGHGRFKVALAGATNQADNSGLFRDVRVDSTLLGEREQRVLKTERGPVNANAFVSLVRQIVQGRWIEQGSMRNERN